MIAAGGVAAGIAPAVGVVSAIGGLAVARGGTVAGVIRRAAVPIGAVVAAGSLVPEGAEVPAGMLALGVPAKPRRPVTPEEQVRFAEGAQHYVKNAATYKEESR